MKILNFKNRLSRFLIISFLTFCGGLASRTYAAPANDAQTFATPKEAVVVLTAAAEANNRDALLRIFGADFKDILTGDSVQDANHIKHLADDLKQHCHLAKEGKNKIFLEVGQYDFPLPIPLVKEHGEWHFDTAAGKEEIINRHIGKDELHAIGVCREFVTAERQYAAMNPDSAPEKTYAQHFKSSPGKKDGLYWPTGTNETPSPFGPLVAEAQSEGYTTHARGTGPHPFQGYHFRILTQQGDAAPGGKMDYLDHGDLLGGFALVAYPVEWGKSGIMTFIVSQQGKVYQANLGEKTTELAEGIKEYNPDSQWSLVKDMGVLKAASQR